MKLQIEIPITLTGTVDMPDLPSDEATALLEDLGNYRAELAGSHRIRVEQDGQVYEGPIERAILKQTGPVVVSVKEAK